MSSTRPSAKRQLISRWGVVLVALAVLAAGCSQSEDGVSDGAEPATSTSQATLGSVTAPLPSAESTVPSTLPSSLATATTQVPVQEEPSGSEIATTTTSLPDSGVGSALSGRVVELVDAGVDACADLYEMRCARAFWDACMQLRIELGSILELQINISASEIEEIDDLRYNVCSLFEIVQYWELHSILSAKYGENFYRSDTGFYSFRDETANVHIPYNPWWIRLFPSSCDTGGCREDVGKFEDLREKSIFAEYLPDDSRIKLLHFAFDMREIFADLSPAIVPMSEDTANRILGAYEALEVDDECYALLLTNIFSNYRNSIFDQTGYGGAMSNLEYNCLIDQCKSGNEKFFIGCYQCSEKYQKFFLDCNPGRILSGTSPRDDIAIAENGEYAGFIRGLYYSVRFLFWEVLKFSCATGEIHPDAYADDTCRTVAYNICSIIKHNPFSDSSFTQLESAICDLSRALERLPFKNAKMECLSELEIFLTNENLFSASDGRCNNATQRCLEFRGEFAYRLCGGFEKYFHIETYWKNIPVLCSQDDPQSAIFGESECYNSINLFCASELNANLKYNTYDNGHIIFDEFESEDIPFREREKVSMALCDKLLLYYNNTIASQSEKLNLLPNQSRTTLMPIHFYIRYAPETIDTEETSTELTSNNHDLINSATTACTAISTLPGNSECAIALWKSCFDLFYSKADHESSKSEVYRSSEYVCTAAWIAELARMASALLSSFPEDYQAGSFNQFLQYITDEAVDRDEGILAIDESGKAQPNLNREGLSTEVAESLTALGNSIAQLVQPYLSLPTANQQSTA